MVDTPGSEFYVLRSRFWCCVPELRTLHLEPNPEPRTEEPRTVLYLCRLTQDALERPTLATAHRPRFDNRDGVADFGVAVLIVDHELGRASLGLAVQPVAHLPFDGDDDALLHLVADDDADFLGFLTHSESLNL